MHRRIAPLFLAGLLALPVVVPASAAEAPTPAPVSSSAPDGRPDATGRYIVMLRSGADTTAVVAKVRKRDGIRADRSFARTFRGFSAKLDATQKRDLLADPNVTAVVPDEVIQVAQTVPTGVARIGGQLNPIAAIDGLDQRVDADVAIVDTGITPHPDLNVAGGYNCATSDRTAWNDGNGHGTHVAGTVAALDNSFGVVGVAPGARVWAVRILNNDGYGLVSWYVCGLDWILAQRDPNDSSRPLFEAVNMSVTKAGTDDRNCGLTNNDPLHQAICRVVAGGITVVAAAANDSHDAARNIPASYDEVITVSALADTDGRPGGLGANACLSWGGYDRDDTFADFSNYGGDVDIMAPGKCILSTIPGGYGTLSGTSMAAPAVAGAVALYKQSRPNATPADVSEALRYLGNLNWATSTDPDPYHEPLLDISRIGTLGTFALTPNASAIATVEGGSTAAVPVTIVRSPTFFERVNLTTTSLPAGWTVPAGQTSVMGWTANSGPLSVAVPKGTPKGTYQIGVQGTNQGRTMTTTIPVNVVDDDPTAQPPVAAIRPSTKLLANAMWVDVAWAPATDPSSAIAGYQLQQSRNGGAWGSTIPRTALERSAGYVVGFDASYRFRVRAVDAAGNWSPWVSSALPTVVHPVDDRSPSISRAGRWGRVYSAWAWARTLTGSSRAGDTLNMYFTGHGVAVIGPRNVYRGSAKVYIDGAYIRTINMWSRTASTRQVMFTRSFPAGGRHRITLRVVGGGSHPNVQLDALVVSR